MVQFLFRVKNLFAVTPIPTTGTVSTQTPVIGTVATQTLAASTVITHSRVGDAAEPEDQPLSVAVAPQKRKKNAQQRWLV